MKAIQQYLNPTKAPWRERLRKAASRNKGRPRYLTNNTDMFTASEFPRRFGINFPIKAGPPWWMLGAKLLCLLAVGWVIHLQRAYAIRRRVDAACSPGTSSLSGLRPCAQYLRRLLRQWRRVFARQQTSYFSNKLQNRQWFAASLFPRPRDWIIGSELRIRPRLERIFQEFKLPWIFSSGGPPGESFSSGRAALVALKAPRGPGLYRPGNSATPIYIYKSAPISQGSRFTTFSSIVKN